jgi:hypothetical protein
MIWFGKMSDNSQLASMVGGWGRGGVGKSLSISLHYLAKDEWQGGRLRSAAWSSTPFLFCY